MTSPDSKSTPQGEGGGMLPALLAGAGILLVAALFIFGGDEDKAQEASEAQAKNGNASASAQTANGRTRGVASRQTDDANKTSRPRPRLNPRIANAVVTEGMAPTPNKKPEPTSFESTDDEIIYWEDQLREANRMLEVREKASEYAPAQEQKIRENGSAEDLAQFQTRLKVVADNLERAEARVSEVEDKLTELRGG